MCKWFWEEVIEVSVVCPKWIRTFYINVRVLQKHSFLILLIWMKWSLPTLACLLCRQIYFILFAKIIAHFISFSLCLWVLQLHQSECESSMHFALESTGYINIIHLNGKPQPRKNSGIGTGFYSTSEWFSSSIPKSPFWPNLKLSRFSKLWEMLLIQKISPDLPFFQLIHKHWANLDSIQTCKPFTANRDSVHRWNDNRLRFICSPGNVFWVSVWCEKAQFW
jgi:hypothetical protein